VSTATAGWPAWASRRLAQMSQISPLVRSSADRAGRLPSPCALKDEPTIIAVTKLGISSRGQLHRVLPADPDPAPPR
jgi:hypothetical protein